MIKKVGKKWYFYTKDGKRILGRHATKKEAESQEAAINISKGRARPHRLAKHGGQAAGHRIPKKK